MTIEQIASLLLQSSRARALNARALAGQLGIPVESARDAMSCAAQYATGVPCDVSYGDTFDQVLARCGRAVGALGASARGPGRPLRQTYVMRPSVLAFTLDTIGNDRLRSHPFVRHQIRSSRVGMLRANQAGNAGTVGPTPGTPGAYASDPTTQWMYNVKAGDSPSKIAYVHTGNGNLSGPGNYTELIDANPGKPTVGTRGTWGFNFASLVAGEVLEIPKSWNKWMTDDGFTSPNGMPYPPNPSPSAPAPVPSGPGEYTSTLPAGRVTALKLELGAWGKKTGNVTTYPGPFDINDVIDESFRGALAQFQQWSNANQGTSLRTDGTLDQPSADALDGWAVKNATSPTITPATNLPQLPWMTTPIGVSNPPIIPSNPVPILPNIPMTPGAVPNPFGGAVAPKPVAGGSSSSSSGSGIALAALALAAAATLVK